MPLISAVHLLAGQYLVIVCVYLGTSSIPMSSFTRGQTDGFSRSTHDGCLVLDDMKYDVIFFEAVGVDQHKIDVVALAHTTLIIGVSGLGDEVQAVKASLLETGDIFVIDKADRDDYDDTYRQFELMLHLRIQFVTENSSWWSPLLLRTIAKQGEGAIDIIDVVDAQRQHLQTSGQFSKRSGQRERQQFISLFSEVFVDEIMEGMDEDMLSRIICREVDPYTVANRGLCRWRGNTIS